MLTCLINYVGVKLCGDEQSESGQFINTLAGISLQSIDNIADDEQETYKGVWADVQQTASVRFYSDVISELQKCFRINTHCNYETMICENKELLLHAWMYLLGNQLMVERLYSTRINRFTTVDKEQAAELRDFYQVEYEKALASAAKFIDLGDCHLKTGGNPQRVVCLP